MLLLVGLLLLQHDHTNIGHAALSVWVGCKGCSVACVFSCACVGVGVGGCALVCGCGRVWVLGMVV